MPQVTSVLPLNGFRVSVKFLNGVKKVVSVKRHLHGRLFLELRRAKVFRTVKVGECGGIEWANGADICPDILYYGGPPPWAKLES